MKFNNLNEGYSEGEEKYHFFYNREERIKNAPKIVQDYYDGKLNPERGFKALFSNRANRFVLISLVVIVVLSWSYVGLRSLDNKDKINGINFELDAFLYEDDIFANIKISSKKKKPCIIYANFFALDQNDQIVSDQEVIENYEGKEIYLRTKFTDYDIKEVRVLINVENEKKELTTDIKR
jgi:endo-1,4-beta-D-glucanase Y